VNSVLILFVILSQTKTFTMSKNNLLLLALIAFSSLTVNAQKPDPARQWFMYRGNYASGVMDNANIPEKWNAETGENIAWKTDIPGLGHSCPVVWGNNVFVTTAVGANDKGDVQTGIYGSIEPVADSSVHEWNLYCIDKKTGKINWEKNCLYQGSSKTKTASNVVPRQLHPRNKR
jgi:outer membrane protein assembly factor BamB